MSREEGMTSPEIAAKLNISVRTVEQHIYKALQDLKNRFIFIFFLSRLSMYARQVVSYM